MLASKMRILRRFRAAVAACAVLLCVSWLAAKEGSSRAAARQAPGTSAPAQAEFDGGADEQRARVVCGGCHAFPAPEILPRDAWRDEFVRMAFIRENRIPPPAALGKVYASVPLPPDMEEVLPYYTSRAPERLDPPEPWPDPGESPVRFTRHALAMPAMPEAPAVSSVRLVDFTGDGRLDVLGTDMRQGVVFTGRPDQPDAGLSVVASVPHPARVTFADLDGDGLRDLIVSDLGAFFPSDHDKGAVILLRAVGNGKFSAFWLDGWPRVADVRVADFNGNGKNDLAVAAFGWRTTGNISILENRSESAARPDFLTHVIDRRPGSIDIIPADLNGDGRMDFVTLLAQEHETVLAYINKGGFTFEQQIIYAAPHPNWGSSGIHLVDLDGDGDLDVLLAHGDTFDDGIVKPYHGIQWLENRGGYPFTAHTLAKMPGVHGITAADLDGDGDLDVVASALLARGADVDESTLPALVWLEQTKPGTFVRHTIAMGFPRHAALDVGDIDGDGDIDIVVGWFSMDKPTPGWVEVWVNQARR